MTVELPPHHPTWADVERARLPGSIVMEQLEAAFERAAARVGRRALQFRIADRSVRLIFAGPALVPQLTAALAHLAAADGGACDLEVLIWDAVTTGVMPELPRSPSGGLGLQRVVAGPGALRRFYSEISGALYCFDTRRRRALCWFERDRLRSWDVGAPLRPVFAWWAESVGAQLAHGAVVGTTDAAVLLAGKGGSGKSTTALACLEEGLLLAGDDYVIIGSGSNVAHSLYSTAKLAPNELELRFPALEPLSIGAPGPTDKRVVALHPARAPRLAHSLVVRAVAAHGVSAGGVAAWRPVSAARALAALAPSSLLQLPGPAPSGLALLAGLVRRAPAFELLAGLRASENAAAVRRLLEQAREAGS